VEKSECLAAAAVILTFHKFVGRILSQSELQKVKRRDVNRRRLLDYDDVGGRR
jgi:hypothetical protein